MKLSASKQQSGVWHVPELEHWSDTYQSMIDNLKSNKPFKFARYGDGEIYCMKGKPGANCDNHSYFPDLGAALRQSISEPPGYMVGIQPLSIGHIPADVENLFGHFTKLYNADVLHNASIEGKLLDFTRALDGSYVVVVGPYHLANIFTNCIHIITSPVNCWLQFEKIKQDIAFHVEGVNNAVVLLAASMMSEVIISHFEDYPHTFIDVGSVFDPYAGVNSRKYHYKLKR